MACPLSFQVIGEYAYVTEEINMEDVLEKINITDEQWVSRYILALTIEEGHIYYIKV